jgi:hypothetical protein
MRVDYYRVGIVSLLVCAITFVYIWKSNHVLMTYAPSKMTDFENSFQKLYANVNNIGTNSNNDVFTADIVLSNGTTVTHTYDCTDATDLPHCKYFQYRKVSSFNRISVYFNISSNEPTYLFELPNPFSKYMTYYFSEYVNALFLGVVVSFSIVTILIPVVWIDLSRTNKALLARLSTVYFMLCIFNIMSVYVAGPTQPKYEFDYGEVISCSVSSHEHGNIRGHPAGNTYSINCVIDLNGKYANYYEQKQIYFNTECPSKMFKNATQCLQYYNTHYAKGKYISLYIHSENPNKIIWHSHELPHDANTVYWNMHKMMKAVIYTTMIIYNIISVIYISYHRIKKD